MLARRSIGSSPWGENCAQVGRKNYEERAMAECRAFRDQLHRMLKTEGKEIPEGFKLTIRANPHDFGTYYDVCAEYDDTSEEASDLALRLEDEGPELWDSEARSKLNYKEEDLWEES